MTGQEYAACRAALGWGRGKLGRAVGVDAVTVWRREMGAPIDGEAEHAILRVMEQEGIAALPIAPCKQAG